MTSQILQLSDLISQSVAVLENICKDQQLAFPRLEDSFTPESEAFRLNATAAEAANIIAAAALQLAAVVIPPPASVLLVTAGVGSFFQRSRLMLAETHPY